MVKSKGEKNINDPAILLQYWNDYKADVDNNPDVQEVATAGKIQTIRVKRPYQQRGFYSYMFNKHGYGVHQYFDNWNGSYDAFLEVVTHIRREWEMDQIEGSLTGRYKAPNLVARLNGIKESTDMVTNGKIEVVFVDGKTVL